MEVIKATESEFKAFLDRLNEPPKESPKLKALLETKAPREEQ